MYKKVMLILLGIIVSLGVLGGISLMLSYNKTSRVNLSVVNQVTVKESQLDSLYEAADDNTIYLFIYDPDNEDCIYLDEVLLRNKSIENQEISFDKITKITYKNTTKAYTAQKIINLYQVETIPALVKIQKQGDKTVTLDKFEWSSSEEDNIKNLTRFLVDNKFITK